MRQVRKVRALPTRTLVLRIRLTTSLEFLCIGLGLCFQCERACLRDQVFSDGDIFTRFFSVAGLLNTTKRRFGGRRVT